MNPGNIVEWTDGKHPHRWRVMGVHLGGLGTESLIHLENISHKPGWTGEWETHQMMFVPECLLRGTGKVAVMVVPGPSAASNANSTGTGIFSRLRSTMRRVTGRGLPNSKMHTAK